MSSSPTLSDRITASSTSSSSSSSSESSTTLASTDSSSVIRTTATTTEMSSSSVSEPSTAPTTSAETSTSVPERGTSVTSSTTVRSSSTVTSQPTSQPTSPRTSQTTRSSTPPTSPAQPAPPSTTTSRPPVVVSTTPPDSARVTETSSPFVSSGVSTTDAGSVLTTTDSLSTDVGTLLPSDIVSTGDPSEITDAASSDQSAPSGSLSSKKGMVAGIFVAVILVVFGIIFVFWLRGRQKRKRDAEYLDAMYASGMAERNSDPAALGDPNRSTPTPPRRRPVPDYEGEERRPWAPDDSGKVGFDSIHGAYVPGETRPISPNNPFADPPQQYKTPLVNRPLRSNSNSGSHKSNSTAPSPLPGDAPHEHNDPNSLRPSSPSNNFTVHQDPYPWLMEGPPADARRVAFKEPSNPRPPPQPYF